MEGRGRSIRAEQARLSRNMRGSGYSWRQVADEFVKQWALTYLQAFRLAHGWSQEQAADQYNIKWAPEKPLTGKHISYWEVWPSKTGKEPSLSRLSLLAEVYECSVSDLLSDLGSKHRVPAGGLAKPDDPDVPVMPQIPGGPLSLTPPNGQDPAADALPRGSDPLACPPLLSEILPVSALTADGSDLVAMQGFRAADLQVGGGQLYGAVLSYLQGAVAPRLFGAVPAGHYRHVFTAASALTEMAGWMAHDAGRDQVARQHFQRSLDFAMIGGDSQLAAHVLGSMSHLAVHHGEPEQAIRLACQGKQVLAKGAPNPALAARLLAMQARGLAALPQPAAAACGEVLLRAEQTLDKDQTESPSPWISRFDEGSLASEAARSLLRLGQLRAAARQAQRIIELRPGSHARSRAFAQLLLANVLVSQGQPEQACAAGWEVLAAMPSLSSDQVVQQLRKLAERLEPYRASRVIAGYLTAVHDGLRDHLWR